MPLCLRFTALTLVGLLMAAAPLQAQERASAPAGEVFSLKLPAGSAAASAANGSVQFIGTATVLIRYQSFTILTDPNFLRKGDHVHLGYGLSAERLTNPAIEFDKLPPIGLGRWDQLEVEKSESRLGITAAPGRHGKAGIHALLPSVMASVLDFGPGKGAPAHRIYISGDTLVYDDLKAIPQRFPGITLALLHLGGTRILGVFKVTMDGKDGVQLLQIIRPQHAIPIHYDDYDVFKSPGGAGE